MKLNIEFPDLVKLYTSDLYKIQSLSEDQETWLCIIKDSPKFLMGIINPKFIKNEKDLEFVFINIFNKIYLSVNNIHTYDDTKKKDHTKIIELVDSLIDEIIKLKRIFIPDRSSIIQVLFESLPNYYHDELFDLINYLWLLPLSVLNFYHDEIKTTKIVPTLTQVLPRYNPLENAHVIEWINIRAKDARELLITSNLSYVKWHAFKYRNYGLDYEDVIQEGSIGLIKAVDKFDVRKQTKLKTYAVWWIKQSILRAMGNDSRVIRLPVHLHESINKIKNEYARYIKIHYQDPSSDYLAKRCGVNVDKLDNSIAIMKPPFSIEELIRCEDELMNFMDGSKEHNINFLCSKCKRVIGLSPPIPGTLIVDANLPICMDPSLDFSSDKLAYEEFVLKFFIDAFFEDRYYNSSIEFSNNRLDDALDNLNSKEREVIELRYGFVNGETKTLQDIAEIMNVTRERIRQIERRAKNEIKTALRYHDGYNLF